MRYEILRPLDSGRGVRVYLATDCWHQGARKIFTRIPLPNTHRWQPAELATRFDLRRSLRHPFLVDVHDLTFRGKQVGLISEFIDGTSLARSPGREFSVDQACRLFIQLLQLMAFLHRRGIICGWIKPSQIFLRPDNSPVLNLLIPTLSNPPENGDGVQYVAPEILAGGSGSVQGDFFSLGMIFYRLLTGHSPFRESDPDMLRTKQLVASPLSPRRINPDVPPAIEALVLEMMRKDHTLRPPNPDYILSALEQSTVPSPERVPPLSSFQVGRDCEAATFRQYYEGNLVRPTLRFLVIRGTSGVGKTTLLDSFSSIVRAKGAHTYHLRYHPGGNDLQALTKLRRQLVAEGVAEAGARPEQDSIGKEGMELGPTLANILIGRARQNPIALFADDLQWMDEASLSFFRTLAGKGDIPLTVIGSLRSDESAGPWTRLASGLAQSGLSTELVLAPLGKKDAERLLTHAMGSVPSAELFSRVWHRCGGNPFYLLEYLRLLRQEGALVYRLGRWEWKPEIGHRIEPKTVVEAIKTRVGRLQTADLELLKHLAVMRVPALQGWLAAALESRPGELEARLRRLEHLEFVSVSGSLAHPLVTFIHDYLREIVRKQLPRRHLKAIHRSLAAVFRDQYCQSHRPEFRQESVFHALRAGELKWAREYLWDSVDWLQTAKLYREAADTMEMALRKKVVSKRSWKAVHRTVELLYLSGQLDRCAELCRWGLNLRRGDSSREALMYAVIARVNAIKGLPQQQLLILKQAIAKVSGGPKTHLLSVLEADLLGGLTRQGHFKEAEQLRRRLLTTLKGGIQDAQLDKIYHSLAHHAEHTGDVYEAVIWEAKAINEALERGEFVRVIGRLVNLTTFHLVMGDFPRGRQLADYSLRAAEEIENQELALFARCASCLHERKEGRHHQAVEELGELSRINRSLNMNLHAETEISIELAKNYNYLLLPQVALPYLDRAEDLLKREYVHPSFVDTQLARGWNWILLGRPEKVEQALLPLDPCRIPAERTNYHLLLSHARLLLGDPQGALQKAEQADDGLPGSMVYYRARVHLARARAQLARQKLDEAETCLLQGLSLSKEGFFYPLMIQAWTLLSQWLLLSRDPSKARSYSLRALYLQPRVDRPGLKVEVLWNLGRVEAVLGNQREAIRRYSQAMQILRERMFRLPAESRGAFRKLYLDPIQADRNDLNSNQNSRGQNFFTYLHQLSHFVSGEHSVIELGERVFTIVTSCLPDLSARLWLRRSLDGPHELVRSKGKARKSGKHLIGHEDNSGACLVAEKVQNYSSGPTASARIRFSQAGESCGILYLERAGNRFSEDEFDFLKCIDGLSRVRMPRPIDQQGGLLPTTSTRKGLQVDGSRVIVGQHPTMQSLFEDIHRIAPQDTTVLVLGESGTGKELVASSLHTLGPRKAGPFVPINCAALPDHLVESELFGYLRGSFTGAVANKRGLFEAASGGTLFLDEISVMPIDAQTRLLRVLQERRVRRLGGTQETDVDVRIVAATNQSLEKLVKAGDFRKDLYYRINVFEIRVPPLRERSSDIPLIVDHLLEALGRRNGTKKRMSKEALAELAAYSFPGNVRELSNVVESAYALAAGEEILPRHIVGRLEAGWESQRPGVSRVAVILEELDSGRSDFWEAVRKPFLERELSRSEVREIVAAGLKVCQGNYRRVLTYFNLPPKDYKKFLGFLSHHHCKVDFRPFRRRA